MAIEAATTNLATLSAMQEGARTMKSMNKNMDVDEVEDVMEDIREQIEVAQEVGQAMATPLGMDDVDEADLEDELERLVDQDLQAQFSSVQVPAGGAKVGGSKVAPKKEEEDDEFAALSAEMGL